MWVSWITLGALFTAGILGGFEYIDQKKQTRTTETLNYVRAFSTPDILDARINLSLHWATVEFGNKWKRLIRETESNTQENREKKFAQLMAEEFRKNNLSTKFFKLVDFYESLWICIREKICNEDIALSYFAETAWRQFAWYFVYLKHELRKIDPTFGKKFEEFAYFSLASIEKVKVTSPGTATQGI